MRVWLPVVCLVIALRGWAAEWTPRTVTLTGPSTSVLLAKNYPRTNLCIALRVTYSKPGVILDTVGINAAPVGSCGLQVTADGHVFFQVFDPQAPNDNSGWHVLYSTARIAANTEAQLVVEVSPDEYRLKINGKLDQRLALKTPLSGQPLYVGDFPGDDRWGVKYNIHPAMTGSVTVSYFGDLATAPGTPAVTPDIPIVTTPTATEAIPPKTTLTQLHKRHTVSIEYRASKMLPNGDTANWTNLISCDNVRWKGSSFTARYNEDYQTERQVHHRVITVNGTLDAGGAVLKNLQASEDWSDDFLDAARDPLLAKRHIVSEINLTDLPNHSATGYYTAHLCAGFTLSGTPAELAPHATAKRVRDLTFRTEPARHNDDVQDIVVQKKYDRLTVTVLFE